MTMLLGKYAPWRQDWAWASMVASQAGLWQSSHYWSGRDIFPKENWFFKRVAIIEESVSVDLTSMGFPLVLLCVGLALGFVVFIFERASAKYENKSN